MKLAIMQPYIFPYIGYYQLIGAVDKFVIYDDVNFISKGWINRNNLLVGNKSHLFTIPLREASQNRLIRDIRLIDEEGWKHKLLKTVEQSYKKAPFFPSVFPMIGSVLFSGVAHIGELASISLRTVSDYLGLRTEFVASSAVYDNSHLKAQQRILDICRIEKADHYINPVGGMEIYSRELFADAGIRLNFLRSKADRYRQADGVFVPNLSMIDVLMFNEKETIGRMLQSYELI